MVESRIGRMLAVGVMIAVISGIASPSSAYPRPGRTERVSVASDGTGANALSAPRTISADGRYVAFYSDATNLVPGDTNGVADLFVRDRGTGTTERVSVASDGTEGNQASFEPTISAGGRFVAFTSAATNLVPDGDTNGTLDVFVRDREAGTTERVSVASDGAEGNGASLEPSISVDGRYIAFGSIASNLIPGDTNGVGDIFVWDREEGTTERVSVASEGAEGSGSSRTAAISADGRYVAFRSLASNLVSGDTNGVDDIFVRDREAGITERVSTANGGGESMANSSRPAISADGRYVAFRSLASNLVPADANRVVDVFVRDRVDGSTERVSVASDGAEGNRASGDLPAVSISADGRYVAFTSAASNLVPEDNSGPGLDLDAFVHDRETGTTERVSVASDGTREAAVSSVSAAISADGGHVAFQSLGTSFDPAPDTNEDWDAFVRDRGPSIGVGDLSAVVHAGSVISASGWATLSGAIVSSAQDPDDDGVGPLGTEIVGASVTYRPEPEDLLLRLRLASLPGPVVGSPPGILYEWNLTLGTVAHKVRALSASATAGVPAVPYFALYRCEGSCGLVRRLAGAIGTTGPGVWISVPIEAVGKGEGTAISAIDASAGLGEVATGPVRILDEIELPDTSIPTSRVHLGVAPYSAPQPTVPFSGQADLVGGRFFGTLNVSSLPPGEYRAWAKACLDDACGTRWVRITL